MANTKISALTSATTPLAGTEVLPIVQTGATVKVATDDLTVKNIRSNATTGILQITGPAAASTRVMTTPNANFTVARTDAAQSFTGDQTLSTGNLVIGTSGKGIDFSATPNTGTSELFADYEEGTFTPTIVGTTTAGIGVYTAQTGRYTKIGNRVYVNIYLSWSAHTGTGNMRVDGLPYTSINVANTYSSFSCYISALTLTAGYWLQPYVGSNRVFISLEQVQAGAVSIAVPMDISAEIMLSGFYEV
jgi:hypothetical protein